VNEIIFLVNEPPEGGFTAEALGHSIFTGADHLDELNEMVRDAVLCHFEEEERPKIIRRAICQAMTWRKRWRESGIAKPVRLAAI
jgi:hypothetical protein